MNIKFKNTILVILSLFTTVATAQTAVTLYDSPFDNNKPYRIPAIVQTSNNDLLVFADKRYGGGDVGQNGSNKTRIDIMYRRSSDNGTNWDNETLIKQGQNNYGYGDVAAVADRENPANIVFFCAAGNTFFTKGQLKCHRFRSTDGGNNWTSSEVTTPIYNALNNQYTSAFFSSGRICQSSKIKVGTHYRLYAALCVTGTHSVVLYSDDFGETWKQLGNVAVSGGNEAKCEELPNGNVLISSRKAGGRYYRVYNYGGIEYVTSTNPAPGSWGSTTATVLSEADGGATNGEILIIPAIETSTGNSCNILLQSIPMESGRKKVGIYWTKLSSDNITNADVFTSNTWGSYKITDLASAYSSMILQADNNIGFVYEDNYVSSYGTGGYDIKYLKLSLETITNNAYSVRSATPVDPTFTLSATSATMTAGETLKLITTTNSDGTVSYSSSNTAVATVDESGNVTAKAAGTATITASVPKTDKYNAASATCTITVKAATVDPDPEPDPTPETTSITITATSGEIASYAYYAATFSHEKAMTVPSGVKAYYVKESGEDAISLTQVPYGQAIPAGQGVLLISTNVSSMTLTEATENVASLTGNLLMPTLSQESVTFGANDYVLVKRNGEFVFAKASGSTVQNYKNHAYLRLNSNQANVRMIFDDNDATGINGIETDEQDAIYYDLMGRRVTNPTKGIYIKNGKKVLFR